MEQANRLANRFPWYGFSGVLLIAVAWPISWTHLEPLTPFSFFPLWMGYILIIDALVFRRTGTSLLTRKRWRVLLIFFISAVFWSIFEAINFFLIYNWYYLIDYWYPLPMFAILGLLDFSTPLPAILETTEMLNSFKPLQIRMNNIDPGPVAPLLLRALVFLLGILSAYLLIAFPGKAFPLTWFVFTFLLDPVNNSFRRKSSLGHAFAGDWQFFVTLPLGALITGFFWEMWNWHALPKWIYTVPYISYWKIFEMPLLGYSGYLPFALELFAMYQFVLLILRRKDDGLVF